MKKLYFSLLSFITTISLVSSQTVNLKVSQNEPLQFDSLVTELDIIKGSSLDLGTYIHIFGGVAPYNISWISKEWKSDSITNSLKVSPSDTSIYYCKVTDANGCTQEKMFKVNVVFPLKHKIEIASVSCFGKNDGNIHLDLSGGAKPYKIIWSDGSTTLQRNFLVAGTYGLTITDQMNQRFDTLFVLNEPGKIETTVSATLCEGNTYVFHDRHYSKTGVYSDTLMSSCRCDSIVNLNLIINPSPSAPVITQKGDTLFSSAEDGNQWYKGDTLFVGRTAPFLIITSSDNYSVEVTNSSGCSSRSERRYVVHIDHPIIDQNDFYCKVSPNPNEGLFMVEINSQDPDDVQLYLFSSDGKLVASKQQSGRIGSQSVVFGKRNISHGIYTLLAKCKEKTVTNKLVVR